MAGRQNARSWCARHGRRQEVGHSKQEKGRCFDFRPVCKPLSEWRGAESRYEGEWQHDEKHGQGIFTFPNGDRCDDCCATEMCFCSVASGPGAAHNVHVHRGVRTCRYEGEWYANCMHGQGTFDDSMGWCYTGGFERDQPTRGVLRAADGQIYSVTYATNCGFIWNGPTPMIKVAV
jgi:hypothetical protein